MSRPQPEPSPRALDRILPVVAFGALGLAGALTAVWLWSHWCGFTSNPWNDIRMAPAIALSRGISVYSTAAAGPASTWIYGPVPLALFAPAGLAPTALTAMQAAGALHLALVVAAFGFICLTWPITRDEQADQWPLRAGAWLLCLLVFRSDAAGFGVFTADAPGIALGLLSLGALARQRCWLAALAAIAAVGCKQTMLGVPVAEIAWLAWGVSRRDAIRQVGRCAVAGGILGAGAIATFGFAGLWHTTVELPGHFPFADVPERMRAQAWPLALLVLAPLGIIAVRVPSWVRERSLLMLPTLAFLTTVPLSLASFLKIGGNVNSLSAFWLWFPAFLVTALHAPGPIAWRRARGTIVALAAAGLASATVLLAPLRLRPNDNAYREAMDLAAARPHAIWFPMHPVVTLYSDGKFYHDYDGLLERVLAGETVNDDRFFAHMPEQRRLVAILLPVGWGPADPTQARVKPGAEPRPFGHWLLLPVDR